MRSHTGAYRACHNIRSIKRRLSFGVGMIDVKELFAIICLLPLSSRPFLVLIRRRKVQVRAIVSKAIQQLVVKLIEARRYPRHSLECCLSTSSMASSTVVLGVNVSIRRFLSVQASAKGIVSCCGLKLEPRLLPKDFSCPFPIFNQDVQVHIKCRRKCLPVQL